MTFHPIELADDVGYAGWYSGSDGRVLGYRLYDGSFLSREFCPKCGGVPGHAACESCEGTGRVEPIDLGG